MSFELRGLYINYHVSGGLTPERRCPGTISPVLLGIPSSLELRGYSQLLTLLVLNFYLW
jgi:hypothetical protein